MKDNLVKLSATAELDDKIPFPIRFKFRYLTILVCFLFPTTNPGATAIGQATVSSSRQFIQSSECGLELSLMKGKEVTKGKAEDWTLRIANRSKSSVSIPHLAERYIISANRPTSPSIVDSTFMGYLPISFGIADTDIRPESFVELKFRFSEIQWISSNSSTFPIGKELGQASLPIGKYVIGTEINMRDEAIDLRISSKGIEQGDRKPCESNLINLEVGLYATN